MDEARLNLAVKSIEGAAVVEAEGELGPWTTEAFGAALDEVVGSESDLVILDLTKVKSMDVGALAALRNACSDLGPDRKLCAIAEGEARKLLELTRFDEVVSVFPEIKQAFAQSKGKSGKAG